MTAGHLSQAAAAYLTTQGIASVETWAAFRLDVVGDAPSRLLPPSPNRRPAKAGIWMPTSIPSQPEVIVGLIRLTPAQNLHAFRSPPAGLACPVDLDQHHRVVLVDNPLLTLRLHQAGVVDVALVEDPAVLPPFQDWLSTKDVLLVSAKPAGIAAMRAALGTITPSQTILIMGGAISAEARKLLGAVPEIVPAIPTAPLSLVTIRDIYEYAVRQVETAAGMALLRAAEFDQPDLITAYRPGYLPDRYRDLLPENQRAHFGIPWKANALVFPAFDERDVVVDLMAFRPESNHTTRSLWPEPQGLLAPVLSTAFDHLIVTDTPCRLGRLARGGTPALLVRGVEDAQANAARLVAGGVRSVEVRAHRDGDAIGAALTAAGIQVQIQRNANGQHPNSLAALRRSRSVRADGAAKPDEEIVEPAVPEVVQPGQDLGKAVAVEATAAPEPAQPAPVAEVIAPAELPAIPGSEVVASALLPTLKLIEHDRQAERAVFTFGSGTYTVTVPHRPTSIFTINVTGPKKSQPMFCDLAVEAARKRNAAMVALSVGLPGPEVAAALVALLPAVLNLIEPTAPAVAPLNPATVPMRADEREEALALLRSEDLVDRAVDALGSLGADPADPATSISLLAAISRLGDRPMWTALTASVPSERFPVLTAIAQATPPDQVIHITRLTAEALNHQDPKAMEHKLLILGDAAEISDRAATSLRMLHDRGVLATSTVERSTQHGGLKTTVVEIHGPIAVLAAATQALPYGLDHHLFGVPVDDSPEAQVRQRQAENEPMADPALLATSQRRRASAVHRLHNLQRLLISRSVAIPDLTTITLPAALAGNRLHRDTLIGLIQASALLHQHQRPTVEGCVVATTADTDLAVRLLHHVAALQTGGLSRRAYRVLTSLWSGKKVRFTMEDLDVLLPGEHRRSYRAALDELVALDFVAAGRGGRGKLRTYTLVATAPSSTSLKMPTPGTQDREVAHG